MTPSTVHMSQTLSRPAASRFIAIIMTTLALLVAAPMVAFAQQGSLAPLAEKISPSVVNITTSTTVSRSTGPQGIVPEGSPFEDFFRDVLCTIF